MEAFSGGRSLASRNTLGRQASTRFCSVLVLGLHKALTIDLARTIARAGLLRDRSAQTFSDADRLALARLHRTKYHP